MAGFVGYLEKFFNRLANEKLKAYTGSCRASGFQGQRTKMTIRHERLVQTMTDAIDSMCADDVKDAFARALIERADWAQVHNNPEAPLYRQLADALKAIPNFGV